MKIESRLWTQDEHALVKDGFDVINNAHGFGPFKENEPFGFVIYENDVLAAGLDGVIKFDWMYIDILFVFEPFRDRDLGTKLMNMAEDLARERGLSGIYLSTLSWQAAPFYQKMGYEEYAVFENFPNNASKHCFRKYL